jgi:Protein of unknown function (DUF3309)
LWEKVAWTKSAPDEGSLSTDRTPHPSSLREATFSRKGRRKVGAILVGSCAGTKARDMLCSPTAGRRIVIRRPLSGENAMSLGLILIIILIIFLLGGFSGRFGGYGYGMGHSGMGLGGVILVVLIILLLLGKL